MNDQVRVGVRHRAEHVEKQSNTSFDVELLGVTVSIELLALAVLEHEVWLTCGRDTRIDHLGDVRMNEPSEDLPFPLEPLRSGLSNGEIQKFDRHAALEAAVAAFGEPYRSHSSLPDRRYKLVSSDGLISERRSETARQGRLFEKSLLVELAMLIQELFQKRGGLRVLGAKRLDP